MIRADIETAVSPIMGNEKQSEDMVNYLLQEFEGDTSKIWQSNIFGRRSADQVEANAGGRKKEAAGDTDPHYQRGQRRPNLYHSVNFKRRGR